MAAAVEAQTAEYCGKTDVVDVIVTADKWWAPGTPVPSNYSGGLLEDFYGYKDQCHEHRCNAWVVDVKVNRHTATEATACGGSRADPMACPFFMGQVRYDHPGHAPPKTGSPHTGGGGLAVLERDCESFEMRGEYYLKLYGESDFTYQHAWTIKAWWNVDYCSYYKVGDKGALVEISPPPYMGYDTHRFAVRAYGRDAYQQTAVNFAWGLPQ